MPKVKLKKKFVEKRKYQRLALPIRIKCKVSPKSRILNEVFSRDISGGGIKLRLDSPLKKGDRLETLLYFMESIKPVRALTRVIWCKKIFAKGKKPYFDVGLQHIKINPKDKMKFTFLFCETMINYFMLGRQK